MASNSYTKNYKDAQALTEAQLDAAYQSLQPDISNTALMTTGSTTGQALLSNGSAVAASFQTLPDPLGPFALRNYGLKATAAAGVLTVSLKTKALATPSGTDIVDFTYSTNTATTATFTAVQVEAATTLSISASATLSFASTSTNRIFVYGYYNTVTSSVKLAVSALPNLDKGIGLLTVAMSASADNAYLYASGALTVVPRLLGFIEAAHNSGGSWQTPSKCYLTNNYSGKYSLITPSFGGGSTVTTTSTTAITTSGALTATGAAMRIGLRGGVSSSGINSLLDITWAGGTSPSVLHVQLERDGSVVQTQLIGAANFGSGTGIFYYPIAGVSFTDYPSAGNHSYRMSAKFETTGAQLRVFVISLEMVEL